MRCAAISSPHAPARAPLIQPPEPQDFVDVEAEGLEGGGGGDDDDDDDGLPQLSPPPTQPAPQPELPPLATPVTPAAEPQPDLLDFSQHASAGGRRSEDRLGLRTSAHGAAA